MGKGTSPEGKVIPTTPTNIARVEEVVLQYPRVMDAKTNMARGLAKLKSHQRVHVLGSLPQCHHHGQGCERRQDMAAIM